MKKKELIKIAKQIAKAEQIISNPDSNKTDVYKAKNLIYELTGHLESMEEMSEVDEMVQEFLKENS